MRPAYDALILILPSIHGCFIHVSKFIFLTQASAVHLICTAPMYR